MAQISYDAIPETANNSSSNGIDFFMLRNDGDEAIVRIMHDDVAGFNIFAYHEGNVGGKKRKINCIRDPKDSIDNCPLCASGSSVKYCMYINMLQYSQDAEGKMVSKPVVWERSLSYANRLKGLINEYGPLSDCIFKIKRNGAAGSMETTYDIFFQNPRVYPEDIYVKDVEAFKSYSALGTIIINKEYNDLMQYRQTGSFPASQQNAEPQQNAPMNYQPKQQQAQTYVPPVEVPTAPPVLDNPPFATQAPAVPQTGVPVEATGTGKPTRYY